MLVTTAAALATATTLVLLGGTAAATTAQLPLHDWPNDPNILAYPAGIVNSLVGIDVDADVGGVTEGLVEFGEVGGYGSGWAEE
ncbi:hypothetical protein [Saccharothrix hoggarensis]|uniref:Uncharacterized protein n=1 Tax=Saccharothrix hoggarensis TaxID=913853 RepID=A0ABW3QM02_9PSEU